MRDHDRRCPAHSPLHDRHVALGAKMADFGGWEMPIEYPGGGVVAEHTAVRERVGIFDVSPPRQGAGLGARAPPTSSMPASPTTCAGSARARPSTRCAATRAGGVVDDLIQYLRSPTTTSSSSPTPPTPPRSSRCSPAAAPEGITVENLHDDYGVIAVQGTTLRRGARRRSGCPVDHDYMSLRRDRLEGPAGHRLPYRLHGGARLRAGARRGTSPARCGTPWSRRCATDGGLPCGLGRPRHPAHRDGLPAARQRPVARRSPPSMAGAAWAVGWDKDAFWGKDALAAERAAKQSRLMRGPARDRTRHPALALRGQGRRRRRSSARSPPGTFSPTLKQGIALALLDRSVDPGDEVVIDVRGREVAATVSSRRSSRWGCARSERAAGPGPTRTPRRADARRGPREHGVPDAVRRRVVVRRGVARPVRRRGRAVSLYRDGAQVYGPMSLEPPA